MGKYEEALERAKSFIERGGEYDRQVMESIFPELKETDDERIRKCLIDMVKRETGFTGFPSQGQVLTFLEKQKQQPTDEEMLRTLRVEYEKGVADTIAKYEREQTEELSTRLNGLMQEYVKSGKDEEEQEHRLRCYQLFWDSLEDSEFFEQFKQKEQKPVAGENPQTSAEILRHYLVWAGNSEEDCPYTWKTLADAIRDGIKALEEQKPAVTSNIDLDTKVNVWVGYMLNDNAQSYSRKDVQIMLDNCARYFYDYAVMCLDKPAEWSEEDKDYYDAIVCKLEVIGDDSGLSNNQIKFLREHCPSHCSEWSEEDERMLSRCIKSVECSKQFADSASYKAAKDVEMNWLKSLHERFNLQPQQEWSGEDEKILDNAYCWLCEYAGSLMQKNHEKSSMLYEIANRLKSLRPQPHTVSIKNATKFGNLEYERGVKDGIQSEKSRQWKPSKEQMEALKDAVKLYKDTHFENFHHRIESLYEQLKQL